MTARIVALDGSGTLLAPVFVPALAPKGVAVVAKLTATSEFAASDVALATAMLFSAEPPPERSWP